MPLAALAALGLVLVVGLGFGGGLLAGGSTGSTPAAGTAAIIGSGAPAQGGSSGAAVITDASDGPGAPAVDPAVDASPEVVPTAAAPQVETEVAIVPVTDFRSARTSVKAADVRAIAGGSSPYKALVLVDADADRILESLGVSRSDLGKRLVTVKSATALATNLAANSNRLAFLRADEVDPSVRAIDWGGKSLYGVDRVKSLGNWPLTARLIGPETPAYDPKAAWTLFAGGDILLDRGVKQAIDANGIDYPYDGGTVKVTGMCRDCSPMGWDLPYTKRTGNAGAVRSLISGADLAIANFENPAPNKWRWHGSGTVFNANPALIAGLRDAGIDWVSLANNHIGDAGRTGMLQTMKNLDKYDIAHGGLGRNTAAAHKATLLEAGEVTVGILGYDMIAPGYHAGTDLAGSARMTRKALKADIKAARVAGADVVIVFPHWGIEYRAQPSATQQKMAHAAIDAGADVVIGNHPHWAEAMEVYKGKPVWYALGNFVFDQTWSDYTMEGLTLELTFDGTRLAQIRMRPHLILGKAQANFMDPAGLGGKFVMDQVWKASAGLLDW